MIQKITLFMLFELLQFSRISKFHHINATITEEYDNKLLIMDYFDEDYNDLIKDKNFQQFYEPLGRDYALLLQRYLDSDYDKYNPIETEELRHLTSYFDFGGLRRITVKYLFSVFFLKYAAMRITFQFWVCQSALKKISTIGKYPNDYYSQSAVCGILAFYMRWFTNLHFERHIFYLKEGLRRFDTKDYQMLKAIDAFVEVQEKMEQLSRKMESRDLKERDFVKWINPFKDKEEKTFFSSTMTWDQMVAFQMEHNYVVPTIYLSEEDQFTRDREWNTDDAIKRYHEESYKIINQVFGENFQNLLGFFQMVITGKKYNEQKLDIPSYELSKRLWDKVYELHNKVKTLNPSEKRRKYDGKGEQIFRNNLIEILRISSRLLFFGKEMTEDVSLPKKPIGFNILICQQTWFCQGGLKFEPYTETKNHKPEENLYFF